MANASEHAHGNPHGQAHPTTREYLRVAVVLTVITLVEFAIVYVDALDAVVAPLLIVLSLAKFALVALFFMHLKYDSRLFSGFFLIGFLLATAMAVAVIIIMAAIHGA